MKAFLKALQTIPEIGELIRRVEAGGCPAAVTGLQPVQRSCVGAAAALGLERPAVFLCGDEREARQLAADLRSLTGEEPALLLSREWQIRPGTAASREWEHRRIAALFRMASGDARTIVATADALAARTMPPDLLLSLCLRLDASGRMDPSALAAHLTAGGYARCDEVEGAGQFAFRGGILDVFSPQMEAPVRMEFFDDEIDSMGVFDPATQRRTENVGSALLLPAAEVLPRCAGWRPEDNRSGPSAESGEAAGPGERTASKKAAKPGKSETREKTAGSAKAGTLTGGAEDGLSRLADALEAMARKSGRRRPALAERLRSDAEQLREGVDLGGMDRYLSAVYPDVSTGADYLPPDAVVFLCESGRVDERLKGALTEVRQDTEALMEAGILAGEYAHLMLTPEELYGRLEEFPCIMANSLPTSRYPWPPRGLLSVNARQLSSYGGSLEAAASDLEQYRKNGTAVLVLCGSDSRARNFHRLLEDRQIPSALSLKRDAMPAPGQVLIALGALSAGCEWPALGLAVLTEGQLLSAPGRTPKKREAGTEKKVTNRQKLSAFTDLSPGDLVVHTRHGIGRFTGMERMPVDGVLKDYIKIDYAGGDVLYVPATQLDQISKYIGAGEDSGPARLNKLGGTDWSKQTAKAKKAVQNLAKGLTKLYAERMRLPGYAFSADSPWQREFEDAFPYAETEDQLRAAEEIKRDMEAPRPMDRLLCGDVGYGKTEVALRAVMKCVLDGKQAAILVPTTVLAQQHYTTAVTRFQNFPVKIAVLSRFTPAKTAKQVLAEAKAGTVDLLIGTHKLLSKNMAFRNLGLLIIDEEQRFGVTHKERLKELSRQIDVLTLSATPIPRTLNMAMSGLRDMSTIEEPPAGRQPVQTYVLEHDWGILADAMRRELARGGQVYYLHNRVETIDRAAVRVRDLLGEEARIVVGHGRMEERELSEVMRRMADGEADVLVCTTIIETGIDIPNVNTLIIEDADRMGLAQLHQIRGRIGRSARRAYAYLTFRRGKILQETASKRLSAIREYVEFGSGFKIAMRDLEIRGAGNLLGPEQSGYLMSVGYDMYLKLLEEAVLEERGEKKETECAADLTVSANIPDGYIPTAEQRMDLYRRIAAIRTDEDASDLMDELTDRYGEPPRPVLALLDIALLRAAAAAIGISDISQRGDNVKFTMPDFHPEAIVGLCNQGKYRRRLQLSAGKTPSLTLAVAKGEDVITAARNLIDDLRIAGTAARTNDVKAASQTKDTGTTPQIKGTGTATRTKGTGTTTRAKGTGTAPRTKNKT